MSRAGLEASCERAKRGSVSASVAELFLFRAAMMQPILETKMLCTSAAALHRHSSCEFSTATTRAHAEYSYSVRSVVAMNRPRISIRGELPSPPPMWYGEHSVVVPGLVPGCVGE